jgi:hypothetical protein
MFTSFDAALIERGTKRGRRSGEVGNLRGFK